MVEIEAGVHGLQVGSTFLILPFAFFTHIGAVLHFPLICFISRVSQDNLRIPALFYVSSFTK